MEERLLATLRLALKHHATDIHFINRYNDLEIEMRVNDVLRKVKSNFGDYKLLSYLQYLANLDLGNLLRPQTGQFEMEVDGNLLSLRFALINSHNFQNGVLRILNAKIKIDVNNLSIYPKQNEYFKSLFENDNGLILFSGPTGSGKTTTIYTLLDNIEGQRIYTIEDPIEIYNDKLIQLEINNAINFNYEEAIKQVLRHDPDIIMIGEIRDYEAANMAIQAANTGHLVIATIHASKASSIINRLLELGINETHLYDVLLSLNNQRMMINKKTNEKIVLYETMDKDEIEYFRINNSNSNDFISIDKQIEKGIKDGIFTKNI